MKSVAKVHINRNLFHMSSKQLSAVMAVLLVAVAGTITLAVTRATTPVASVQAEAGTLNSSATSVADTTASGAKAVKFTTASTPTGVSATTPCVHAAAPAQWKHVILLMFENESYGSVIGNASAPYITNLARHCGTILNWHDGNYKVDGSVDGNYVSKPSYATLTSGLSPSVTGLKDDSYGTTTTADNIFNRLNLIGKSTKSYQSGSAGSCASSNFSGAYHDAMRYYTNLGGQSSSPTTYCNMHDVPISTLVTDMNSGNLPAFSLVLPTNDQNMHNNGVASGDAYAKTLIDPILNSTQYKAGDTAFFFIWDEETPIPNVMLAPSIAPGTTYTAPAGSFPISHFSFTRTAQEMLGVPQPFLGVSGQAPSLLNYFNGH